MAVEQEYHKRGTRGGAANKKRVWWELQEDVIDEVQQRFGFTPPKLQWEQGSEVQLAALRAWNRDVTEQRWEELHRWHQPTALRIRAIREEERRAAATGAAGANPVPATPSSPTPSTPPQQQAAQPSVAQQASPAEAWLSAPALPTARTAAQGAVTGTASRRRTSTTSPRSVSRQVLRAVYSQVPIVLRSRSRSRTPTPIQEAGRRVENLQNSSPDDQSILAWQIKECAIKDLQPTGRSRWRQGARPIRRSASTGPARGHCRGSSPPALHGHLPAEPAHVYRSSVILTSCQRTCGSAPNYGNAEVYHLADYTDGDTVYNTEDLLSGRAAFRAGGVYEAPFHRPTVPASPPAPATKATVKCGTRPAARGTVAAFLASSRGRVLSKARSSSPPRLAAPPARKASVPANSWPGPHIRYKQPPASLRLPPKGQGAAFGAPDPPWRQPRFPTSDTPCGPEDAQHRPGLARGARREHPLWGKASPTDRGRD